MNQNDLTRLPVHEVARQIAARALSPIDVVEAYLARIERHDPKLHAYTEVYADDARLAARGAEAAIRSGHAVGPLHGVPIALKDLIELEGRVVSGGCEAWTNRRATRTATLARRLIASGMIVLGKTHTVEFAMGGWGTNTRRGTPWNPWDPKRARTPGGSSSGSGVAVAAGLAPWAVGTDTGGSVRLPASWCGITGLKTTIGRVSTHGVMPLSPTLDTPGPMARSVEDAALLYTVMQGADPLDPLTRGLDYVNPMPTLKRGVRGLRLARMPDVERQHASADVLAAYDRSLAQFERLGAEIVDVKLPFLFADVASFNLRIMAAESYALYASLIDDEAAPLDPHVRPRIAAGRDISSTAYIEALRMRETMKSQFAAAMEGIDALLTPTTMTTAVPLEQVDQTKAPAHYTRFANYLDLTALALPNGIAADGLPTSLQIVCRASEEATALRIGWAVQEATEWHLQMPPGAPAAA
ncbi:amidase [Ramlibacter sp. MMS24-I3-19]|uniref:amidase n=1 Tax=Ramlibacter sp. MMS24-I3-19 TaxID=3416606 RepID=UPI003D056112